MKAKAEKLECEIKRIVKEELAKHTRRVCDIDQPDKITLARQGIQTALVEYTKKHNHTAGTIRYRVREARKLAEEATASMALQTITTALAEPSTPRVIILERHIGHCPTKEIEAAYAWWKEFLGDLRLSPYTLVIRRERDICSEGVVVAEYDAIALQCDLKGRDFSEEWEV